MKLIKAYVRTTRVDEVVRALEAARAPGTTLSRVHGVGYGYEPLPFALAPSDCHKMLEVSKIGVACPAADADRFIGALAKSARSGVTGDGIVLVTPVECATKIRTGEKDALALENPGGSS